MHTQNHSKKQNADDRSMRSAKFVQVLTSWFTKWLAAFPTHEVSKIQMAVYLEALDDLTPEQLDRACREATRSAEQFPKPGHIREALARTGLTNQFSGPPRPKYLDEPKISEEERASALKFSDELRKKLGPAKPPLAPTRRENQPRRGFKSAEEQKAELRAKGYL